MKVDWKKVGIWTGLAVAGAVVFVVALSAVVARSNLQHKNGDR